MEQKGPVAMRRGRAVPISSRCLNAAADQTNMVVHAACMRYRPLDTSVYNSPEPRNSYCSDLNQFASGVR
jgi:hypothetical protein